jgi:hypothetical protein
MSHVMPIPLPTESPALSRACPFPIPPRPPRGTQAAPFRFRLAHPEPWWREALRWSLAGLVTSWAAGEATLWLIGL